MRASTVPLQARFRCVSNVATPSVHYAARAAIVNVSQGTELCPLLIPISCSSFVSYVRPFAGMEDTASVQQSQQAVEPSSYDHPRERFGGRPNPNLRRLSVRLRDNRLPGGQRHVVETARVAAMLRSISSSTRQPELYTVPEGDESDDEPAAAHAAPRTIQQSKELLDRVDRMRKFHSHDYEPPVRVLSASACRLQGVSCRILKPLTVPLLNQQRTCLVCHTWYQTNGGMLGGKTVTCTSMCRRMLVLFCWSLLSWTRCTIVL